MKMWKVCAKLETEGGVLDKFRAGSRPNFLFYVNGEQVTGAPAHPIPE